MYDANKNNVYFLTFLTTPIDLIFVKFACNLPSLFIAYIAMFSLEPLFHNLHNYHTYKKLNCITKRDLENYLSEINANMFCHFHASVHLWNIMLTGMPLQMLLIEILHTLKNKHILFLLTNITLFSASNSPFSAVHILDPFTKYDLKNLELHKHPERGRSCNL